MEREQKKPDKIIHVGGKEFRLYSYIDEYDGQSVLDYPNFEENPEYTDEGRPYKLPVQEDCFHWKSTVPDSPYSGDCGSCALFHRDEPLAAIGICMCEELRLAENQNNQETVGG